MAYIQGETINLTANSGGLLLFSSATGSSYDPNPDAKVASITKKVTISDTVISSGGTLYVSCAGATISGAHIYDSGVLTGNKAAVFTNLVVHSGGSFWRTSTGASAVNLSAYSGSIVSGWNGGATILFLIFL